MDVAFGLPANGQAQTVVVNYVDAAGNAAADKVSDTATLDITAPTNAGVNLALQMTTDGNNDGWVNATELGSAATFTSRASFDKAKVAEGESIVFNATNGTTTLPAVTHKLTAADISNGYVAVTFNKPGDGQLQTVTARYMDKAGNLATDTPATDKATLDTLIPSAPNALNLTIDLDKDNNGYINGAEKSAATSLTADFSAAKEMVSVGDVLTFKIGTATQDVTIDQTMLQNGKVTLSGWDKEVLPAEGNTLAASVMLKDVAGNATGWFNDTAILDFTGMAFTGQKPDLDTTTSKTILKGIEFSHKMTEDGSFSLSVGSFLYTGKIVNGVTHYDPAPKNFTSEITVTGKEVQLFFTDLAGNQTTSIYDAGTGNSVYPTFTFIV